MAEGVPVFSTTIGAEGLPVWDGEANLLADEPGYFANTVIRILYTPALAGELSREARELLVRDHGWEAVVEAFLYLIDVEKERSSLRSL
jgi:glycosyltransferase involved in cell wall biosynthesis